MEDPSQELHEISDRMYELTGKLIEEGQRPFAIAAIYIMIAMQIYRTMMSDEDYNQMVDAISANRDNVMTLTQIAKSTLN